MLKKENTFFLLPCSSLGYLDETNSSKTSKNSNFLYRNRHYHNFCINVVSHPCIPNEVGGARDVYVI